MQKFAIASSSTVSSPFDCVFLHFSKQNIYIYSRLHRPEGPQRTCLPGPGHFLWCTKTLTICRKALSKRKDESICPTINLYKYIKGCINSRKEKVLKIKNRTGSFMLQCVYIKADWGTGLLRAYFMTSEVPKGFYGFPRLGANYI